MATYKIGILAIIGNFKPFRAVHSIEIKKSLNNFMDTARIKLPARCYIKKNDGVELSTTTSAFKRGDKVELFAGYNNIWSGTPEFEGFVSRVNNGIPVEIECEGYAFQLRDKYIQKIYRGVSVRTVLQDLVEGTDIILDKDMEDMQLDRLDFPNKINRLEALSFITQSSAGNIAFWFKGKTLYAGLKYLHFTKANTEGKADTIYRADYNYPRGSTFREKEKEDYSVELHLNNGMGKKEKVSHGPMTGMVRSKKISLISPEQKELARKMAENATGLKSYDGVDGSIQGFLIPYCEPGYKVEHIDKRFEALSGKFLCDEVNLSINQSGARRTVKLSYKL